MLKSLNFKFIELRNLSRILRLSERRKLKLIVFAQLLLSILDLMGVGLIGVIGALAINGVQSRAPGDRVSKVLSFLRLDQISFQLQTVSIAILAVALLIARSLLSVLITRRTLFFLSRRAAEISSRLIEQVMSQPLSRIKDFSAQYIHYTLSTGANSLALGVFGNLVSVLSDFSLLLVLGIGLLVFDPITALLSTFIFGTILVFLYRRTNQKTRTISSQFSNLSIRDSEILLEMLSGYRESFIRNRRGYFVGKAQEIKSDLADYSAELSWLPNISKYVIEISFTLGTLFLAMLQFVLNDASRAIGSLTLFLAAGSRITPALLRLQQNLVSVNGNIARAKPTVELLSATDDFPSIPVSESKVSVEHNDFSPSIELTNVNFSFSSSEESVLKNVNLKIFAGQTVAIVGPSGAGKSTLIDLILGIYIPTSGSIKISGKSPVECISKWPGAIGYVPQEVVLRSGSISENISSGFDMNPESTPYIVDAVSRAQLSEFLLKLPEGLSTQVGERGSKLSGGQRQRVGIARALFTKPKLLVLDEATSSLDAQTEFEISKSISRLRGQMTVLIIAHRLSTIKDADLVIYLKDGEVASMGDFESVRKSVPDFDQQAIRMGL